MDMILVVVPGFEKYGRIMFSDFEQFPFKVRPQALIDHFATVFGRDDEVILAVVDTVTAFSVFHCITLAWTRGRGSAIHPTGLRPGVSRRRARC